MTDAVEQISIRTTSTGRRTACMTAKVAGVFSVIFLVVFVGNFIGSSVIGPSRENELTDLKTQVGQGEATEEQLAEIRQLDLRIRRDRIWRLDFARKTGYMLLGAIVVFLVAGKAV